VSRPETRLKYVATINNEALGEDTDPDYELQYIDIGNVDSSGQVHEAASYRFADAPSRARRRVRHGDVIFSCVRTYLQAIAPIESPPGNLIVSTGFAVVRPIVGRLRAGFCKYALREPSFLAEVERRSVGVSYPAINSSDLAAIAIPVPPDDVQLRIEKFLDRETRQLDALVAAKQRALDLLAEKRKAIIATAVTRGLDLKVKLRDSGVPWLGEIPGHWETKRLKYLGQAIIGLTYAPAEAVMDGSGTLVLRASNVQEQRIVLDDMVFVSTAIPPELLTRVGDILICSRSGSRTLIGKCAMIGDESKGVTFGAFMTVFRGDYNSYLFQVFNSPLFEYQAGAFGTSTINQLTVETLNNMEVPLPPIDERQAIAEHISRETAKLDAARAGTERTIALLKERRSALIAAAVTGQLDVGAAA